MKDEGPAERLVPFAMTEKAIPRQGMAVAGGGVVTSGTLSPMLEIGIGLARIPAASAHPGTELVIDVRGKERRAEVKKKPLYSAT